MASARPIIVSAIPRSAFVDRIQKLWRSSVESIIEVGRELMAAKAELGHGEFEEMIATDLPFGDRTAERLMAISRHPVLSNPTHVPLLPPSWGTLHALSQLDTDVLEQAIEDGKVTPSLERHEVRALAGKVERVREYPFRCPACGTDELRRLHGAPKETDGCYYVEVHECLGECKKLWLCGTKILGETDKRYV